MSGFWTGLVGSVVEAWAELRIHRTRVLLSLIGVAVAVAAITTVVGLGAVAQQSTTESYERSSGRPATLFVSAYNPETGMSPPRKDFDAAFATVLERYSIDFGTRNAGTQINAQFVDGVTSATATVVDVDYGTMHRVSVDEGQWFTDADEQRLAPAVVVNSVMWERLGSPPLTSHPTVELIGAKTQIAVIVGVTPSLIWEEYPSLFILTSGFDSFAAPDQVTNLYPQYEAWVPASIAQELADTIRRDIVGALGEGWQVDVSRQDYQVFAGEDPLLPLKLLVGGVAGLVLLLGALGLVNISLVTVGQRIREIGIRRSFGATAGRVFFAVMMESVVATLAAGVVGVAIAIVIVKNPLVIEFIGQGVTDVPAFPIEAALLGLGVASAVGALAGLLPAIVAVRVKVIDAIRY